MEYKHVGRLIKTLTNSFEKEFNKVALKHDLTTSQSMVLIYLQKNKDKEISPIDIEKHFNYSHASILGILKRLKEKNFITIKQSNKDKRYRIIEISDKGNNI
jgi:DNA-binding MarR family transcriptional regulator